MEKVELVAQIVALDAKIKVLLNPNMTESYGDSMNEYFEETSKPDNVEQTWGTSALEFIKLGALPKLEYRKQLGTFIIALKCFKPTPVKPCNQYYDSGKNQHNGKNSKDITELIIMQQNVSLLPKREVPVFKGDPLSCQPFMHAFKYLIEDKKSSSQDRLCFLEQFTAGQARDLVHSCMHMDAQRRYSVAMQLLEKHSHACDRIPDPHGP